MSGAPKRTYAVLNSTTAPLSSLAHLHTAITDVVEGLEAMSDQATPELKSVAEGLLAMHRRHAAEIARVLGEEGAEFDPDPSLQGTINEAVVKFRALFGKLDLSALDNVIDGERALIDEYADILGETNAAAVEGDPFDVIRAQAHELEAHVGTLDGSTPA